jgi:hypothetical protein
MLLIRHADDVAVNVLRREGDVQVTVVKRSRFPTGVDSSAACARMRVESTSEAERVPCSATSLRN